MTFFVTRCRKLSVRRGPGVTWLGDLPYEVEMRTFLDALSRPRAVAVTIFGFAWTLWMSVVIITCGALTGRADWLDFLLKHAWCRPILWLGGVKVEVRGVDPELLRAREGFLILFNHSSHLDIMTLFAYFPRGFRFGAKIELFKIPFFGAAMRVCGILPIDRANRGKVLKVYQAAIDRVRRGECFALAPEGTRQPTAKLGPFKRGPFEFAIQAQMPIVPVILAGTNAILPRNSVWLNWGRWRRRVIVQLTPAIAAKDYTSDRSAELQSKVREQMLGLHDILQHEVSV